MTWLKLLALAMQLGLAVVTLLRDRRLIKDTEAGLIAESLEVTHARIEEARAARRAAADGMSGDDPYIRD